MRRIATFTCEGVTLFATIDEAPGDRAVVIVSGGNEVRAGAHRGMAMLAARLAARGIPVLRYDRRGVGDSDGVNGGWNSGAPDLAAAVALLRDAQPQVGRVIGFGNCDGAATLALFGRKAGIDALVLGNPWLGGDTSLPPPAAIRARYAARLRDPAAWRRLVSGWRGMHSFLKGLRAATKPLPEVALVKDMAEGVATVPTMIVLARNDRTAQTFAAHWRRPAFDQVRDKVAIVTLPTDSHSFADAAEALEDAIFSAL